VEGSSFVFPYLSGDKAEQCTLRTSKVFVDLAWADNVVRGVLWQDVTYGRLNEEARLVFNDMPLALALGLYFPPLAFPLNAAGHLMLAGLFETLTQSRCSPCVFPYLSGDKAEQCTLRTSKVFVDVAWADNVVRGVLWQDVTYGRLNEEARLVFNDMPLALALGLYFPPLAFPLNAAGHLMLAGLFETLIRPGHSELTSAVYVAYSPTHAKLV